MDRGIPPLAVAVAGHSGAGKTTLLERAAGALSERGLEIGYLKSGAHRIDLDLEGKDSERLRRAGAAPVAVEGRGGRAHFPGPGPQLIPDSHDPAPPSASPASLRGGDHLSRVFLWNLRHLFGGCDLLLIEGMKASPLPKILVNRADNPRGILPPDALRHVVLHLLWPCLPKGWEDPVSSVVTVIDSMLRAPARVRARGVDGVVLAGGSSSRMGEDKARLPLVSKAPEATPARRATWCEYSLMLLAERCASARLVGRIAESGGPELPLLERPVSSHLDLRPGAGILGGMETALLTANGRAVLTLPCDLPALAPECIDRLLEGRDPEAAATAFRRPDGRAEPAVALLEPRSLDALRRYLDAGERRAWAFLESIPTRWLSLTPALARRFTNPNTPEERRRFEEEP